MVSSSRHTAPRFAPLRYRILIVDTIRNGRLVNAWRWRQGYAIHLPSHPRLRFCCWQDGAWWRLDHFDTGLSCTVRIPPKPSRGALLKVLLANLPWITRGGRITQRVRRHATAIRQALRNGEAGPWP